MRKLFDLLKLTGGKLQFLVLIMLRCPLDTLYTLNMARFLQKGFEFVQMGNEQGIFHACFWFGFASLLLFLYNGTVWIWYAIFTTHLEGRLRKIMFEKVEAISLPQLEAKTQGDWITRLNTDTQMAAGFFTGSLQIVHLASAAVSFFVFGGFLLATNQAVFGLVILFVIPHVLIGQLWIARPMTELAKKSQQARADNTSDLNTLVTCAETAMLFQADEFLMGRFEKSSLAMRSAQMRMHRRQASARAMYVIFGIGGYLAILFVGGVWIAAGVMTFGALTAAFQLRNGMLKGVLMTVNCASNIRVSVAAAVRVSETLELKKENTNG